MGDRIEVKQFQIVQKAIDHFVVKFVSDQPLPRAGQELLRADFAKIVGPGAELTFEEVDAIPRKRGGKFMTALSEVSASI